MVETTSEIKRAVQTVIDAIQQRLLHTPRPCLVAIDGGSGAGKSTLALIVARKLNAAIIPGDDFYAADIPNSDWDRFTPEQRYAAVINWRRLRSDALEPLLSGQPARWFPFDFQQPRPDGTYALHTNFVERQPADLIVLEGAYAARPELADLINLSILVDVPIDIRHQRLFAREDAEFLAAWHQRWDAVEAYYFTHVRPKSSFDVVITAE